MVVFLSDICWDSLTQRPQHIAARLAKRQPVLWVEPITLGHRWSLCPREAGPGLQLVSVPHWPLNARASWMRALARILITVGLFRTLLERLQAVVVGRALRRLGWSVQEATGLVQNFQLLGLLRRLGIRRLVFDYIDDAFGFVSLPQLVEHQWQQTIRAARWISVTAPRLGQLISKAEPEAAARIRLVPNGVEFERFASPVAPPADLPRGAPVLCYVGSVYPWLDFGLLHQIGQSLPQVRLVLIGRSHPEVVDSLRALEKHANFLYLGARPYRDVPAYLQAADVGIIPFARTRLTEAVNPVKLYEYAAAGLPIISTAFSDDLQTFGDAVLIGSSVEEFLRLIPLALQRRADAGFRDRLRAFARDNDWDARAEALAGLLEYDDESRISTGS